MTPVGTGEMFETRQGGTTKGTAGAEQKCDLGNAGRARGARKRQPRKQTGGASLKEGQASGTAWKKGERVGRIDENKKEARNVKGSRTHRSGDEIGIVLRALLLKNRGSQSGKRASSSDRRNNDDAGFDLGYAVCAAR